MILRHINFICKMESAIYYSALENLNRGLVFEMENLKKLAEDLKQEDIKKESKEERKIRKKLAGEFEIDSDEEDQIKQK
jgi:hypothetical protein